MAAYKILFDQWESKGLTGPPGLGTDFGNSRIAVKMAERGFLSDRSSFSCVIDAA